MCVTRGETADRKRRCGIKRDEQGIGIYCFNCNFRTRFKAGDKLSRNMRNFLEAVGVSDREVKRIGHHAMAVNRTLIKNPEIAKTIPSLFRPSFTTVALPDGARPIRELAADGCSDPDFIAVVQYLVRRGEDVFRPDYFYWSPSKEHHMNRRALIPFHYGKQVVGYTGRLVDTPTSTITRYHMSSQNNYLFNNSVLTSQNKYLFLVEGPFDAIAIGGVATLGARMTDEQGYWLNSSGKKVIVVPDRDVAGQRQIDLAITHGWSVAFPRLKNGVGESWWDEDIKDPADAAKRYGSIYTIKSLIETATDNRMQISIKRKLLL